jgi:hypothetical protein
VLDEVGVGGGKGYYLNCSRIFAWMLKSQTTMETFMGAPIMLFR